MNMVVLIFHLMYMTSIVLPFCCPDTRAFYVFAQEEGHYFAAPLFISRCKENVICPVL